LDILSNHESEPQSGRLYKYSCIMIASQDKDTLRAVNNCEFSRKEFIQHWKGKGLFVSERKKTCYGPF